MTLIAQISDLHLRPRGIPAYRVVETNMLAERAIEALLALRPQPDAVVVTGDIADGWIEAEYQVARRLFDRLPMPYYLLSGNHDDTTVLKKVFADLPFAAQGRPDRLFYSVEIGDLRLVALDSSAERAGHGELSDDQLAFLDARLADGGSTIVAIHHPPFRTGVTSMDKVMLRKPEALAEVLGRHKNVLRLLCGHVHRPTSTIFGGTLAVIAPSVCHQIELSLEDEKRFAFNFEPPAYYLHRWVGGEMTTHLAYVERFPGPYPFYPERGFPWQHPI